MNEHDRLTRWLTVIGRFAARSWLTPFTFGPLFTERHADRSRQR